MAHHVQRSLSGIFTFHIKYHIQYILADSLTFEAPAANQRVNLLPLQPALVFTWQLFAVLTYRSAGSRFSTRFFFLCYMLQRRITCWPVVYCSVVTPTECHMSGKIKEMCGRKCDVLESASSVDNKFPLCHPLNWCSVFASTVKEGQEGRPKIMACLTGKKIICCLLTASAESEHHTVQQRKLKLGWS